MNRQAPSLHILNKNTFCGVKRDVSPLTSTEIRNAGFEPALRQENYVENSTRGSWMQNAAMFVKKNHIIVGGPAGTGKDIFIETYCHAFNLPLASFAFKQGTNPVDWIVRTTLVSENGGTKTVEVDGDLLRACRGVTCKRDFTNVSDEQTTEAIASMRKSGYTVENNDGMLTITVPAIILFSDYDRGTSDQVEVLRQALEMNKERLTNPVTGEMFRILPGTRFYFTANSGADGDGGRGNITQMKDSSMLSRCVAVYAPPPTVKFERQVVQAEFPQFNEEQVALLVDCNRAIRKVSEEQSMGIEITLRQAKQWGHCALQVMEDLEITDFKEALKASFCVVKDHLHETHNRDALEGAIDPFLRSNVVDQASEDICPIDL